jgi:hypothetical protein
LRARFACRILDRSVAPTEPFLELRSKAARNLVEHPLGSLIAVVSAVAACLAVVQWLDSLLGLRTSGEILVVIALLVLWLRERLVAGQGSEVREYRKTLKRLTDRYRTGYAESVGIQYWIGAAEEADRVVYERKTEALPQKTLLWRTIELSVTGAGNRQHASFREVGLEVAAESGHVDFLPLEETTGGLVGMVVFDPVIEPEAPREWNYELTWSGMWNELRTSHSDTAVLTVTNDYYRKAELLFIFPRGAVRPLFRTRPPEGRAERTTYQGLEALRWTCEKPRPGRYNFDLQVEAFGPA